MIRVDCQSFRAELEQRLLGRPAVREEMFWNEHLLQCAACRDMLEAEHALEALLASLPEPMLPADLTRRVLQRLASERSASLDTLLELDRELAAPEGLGQRVLSSLAAPRRSALLDRALERVPAPVVPVGLAERVLSGLESERVPLRRVPRGLQLAAAAAVIFTLVGIWGSFFFRDAPTFMGEELGIAPEFVVEEGLLASLDVLENWDLLMGEDVDLLLAELDPVEENLIEMPDEEGD